MEESLLKATKTALYDEIAGMPDKDPRVLAAMNVIDAIDELLEALAGEPPDLTADDMEQIDKLGAMTEEEAEDDLFEQINSGARCPHCDATDKDTRRTDKVPPNLYDFVCVACGSQWDAQPT